MPKTRANKFITFEGGEGSGKSTQSKILAEYLKSQGHEVVITREPGGTKNAEEIRKLLINGAVNKWDGMTEVLLNFAARNEHIKNLIKPALDAGKWVISDRFFDSTIVYQGYGQGQDISKIHELIKLVVGDIIPDLTILMDYDPEKGVARAQSRGDHNRYEKMGLDFHQKIRNGFLEIAKHNPQRIKVINSDQSIESISQQIKDLI